MKVLLVGTGIAAPHAQGGSRRYNLATPCLHAYIQARPELSGIEVTRFDLPFYLDAPQFSEAVVERVLDVDPDVLGLSCYAWDIQAELELARRVRARKPGIRVVVGGPSVSYETARVLEENPAVDVAVRGEGEEVLAALLASDWKDLSGIPGIAWRAGDGSVREQALGPPVADLATLRSPILDGVLRPPKQNLLLETSRGCVYRCKHCAWQMHGRGLRFVSTERISAEYAWAREEGYAHAFIIDSAINNHSEWLDAVADAIHKGNPEGDVYSTYFLNYRFITPDQVRALARIRTHEILIGLESVNPVALRATGRKPEVEDEFARAVDLIAEGVGPVTPNIMLGMPGDTLEGFRSTLDYIARLAELPGPRRIRHARAHWTIIPPGSRFAMDAEKFGIRYNRSGIPYVLGTSTFPEDDLRRALELIADHPRADLFVWEDAEPLRILGGTMPKMTMAGGGRLGAPAPERIADETVLEAIAPLSPGRPLRQPGWKVGAIEREHGFPVVVLLGPGERNVRLQLRHGDSNPGAFARTATFDLLVDDEQTDAEAQKLLRALVDLVLENDGDPPQEFGERSSLRIH